MKALIVDDHPMFVSALETLLRGMQPHLRADTASSVAEALACLDKGVTYQLILADLAMPGLDGLALLRILDHRRINTPVVVVSSSEEPDVVRGAIDAGAVGFIPKSYRIEHIRAALERILAGEIFVPDELAPAPAPSRTGTGDEAARLARCGELGLTRKHYQVLLGLAEGLTNKEIARRLYISVHTVKAHNARLFERLHTANRMDTVMEAIRLGLIDQ